MVVEAVVIVVIGGGGGGERWSARRDARITSRRRRRRRARNTYHNRRADDEVVDLVIERHHLLRSRVVSGARRSGRVAISSRVGEEASPFLAAPSCHFSSVHTIMATPRTSWPRVTSVSAPHARHLASFVLASFHAFRTPRVFRVRTCPMGIVPIPFSTTIHTNS